MNCNTEDLIEAILVQREADDARIAEVRRLKANEAERKRYHARKTKLVEKEKTDGS